MIATARDLPDAANLPPPLPASDRYSGDAALREAVQREGAAAAEPALQAFGRVCGDPDMHALAVQADAHPPRLHTHDRWGLRCDTVTFHPAWHQLLALGVAQGLHGAPWGAPGPGAHVARAAAFLLLGQVENGVQCPITMTHAGIGLLLRHADALPAIRETWLPRLLSRRHDPSEAPAQDKQGLLLGMGMTERQGGSDVRSNSTRATPVAGGGPGRRYRLDGHKFFFSAPQSDGFLVLAQAAGGLSCFLLPRWLDGVRQPGLQLQRLKDKLGNRSNASSEVEFHGAVALLVGEEGQGVPTILDMVNVTRLDCGLGSAAVMRAALLQALHHAAHRRAFGRALVDQPAMQAVLADLALESEAATALMLRLARTFDPAPGETAPADGELALRRLATPAAKFWICKRLAAFVQEAMEVLGGPGYVEDSGLPRLYREAPLNSIWEGAGNVMALDVLRAARSASARAAFAAELARAQGGDPRLDAFVAALLRELAEAATADDGSTARHLAMQVVLALQASVLVRHAPAAVADAFCATRLAHPPGGAFGLLPSGVDKRALVARAAPA